MAYVSCFLPSLLLGFLLSGALIVAQPLELERSKKKAINIRKK
uniref:Uncharacterized protein MANES_01G187400 n=1 Tax=Rhizophora mucronata TaxID=61149 RepID=A0A2P2PAC8_RHIMU